jgi:DNA-binding transcriptional MerR regulator
MRIGELERRSGFTIDTLRYYDRIGLVTARRNPTSRFREYEAGALDMLRLVRLAKVAGLSLPQIRRILAASRRGRACGTVVPLLDSKIAEIDRAIRALQKLRSRLARALSSGRSTASGSCPILEDLGVDA